MVVLKNTNVVHTVLNYDIIFLSQHESHPWFTRSQNAFTAKKAVEFSHIIYI